MLLTLRALLPWQFHGESSAPRRGHQRQLEDLYSKCSWSIDLWSRVRLRESWSCRPGRGSSQGCRGLGHPLLRSGAPALALLFVELEEENVPFERHSDWLMYPAPANSSSCSWCPLPVLHLDCLSLVVAAGAQQRA